MARDDDSNCSELNKFMNGLCVECLIVFLSILDVLFITTELLIRVDVISDTPTPDVNSSVTYTAEHAPSYCRKCVLGSPLEVAYCASHYASVTIAGLFLTEVFLRLVAGCPGCWKDALQVFDGFVVVTLCVMEILFTLFWTKVICYHVAIEASTYIVIFRFCRIHRACSVRKRRYAERLENEMHYLRRAKSKAEDHARDLTGKLKKQQKEIYELSQKLSVVAYIKDEQAKTTTTLSENNCSPTGNGHVPNGVIQAYAENKSTQIVEEAKEELETGVAKRQNSVQYKSLMSEIENRSRSDILQKSARSKSSPSMIDNTTPQKHAATLPNTPKKGLEPRHSVAGHSPSPSFNMSLKKEIETKALSFTRDKPSSKSMTSVSKLEKERTLSGVSNSSSTNEADVVTQLEKIVKDNEVPSPFNSVSSKFSGPSPGSTVNSRMSMQSTETEDDQAVLIRRGNKLVHGHVNSAFRKDDEAQEVRMRKDMEVMAEYEGTRTYRSAEGIPLTDL